jgi:hypothetical protein
MRSTPYLTLCALGLTVTQVASCARDGALKAANTTNGEANAALPISSQSAAVATSAAAPSSSTAPKVPRDVATGNILGALTMTHAGRFQIGQMAAAGMSEEGYGLPAAQLKALVSASSNVNPRRECAVAIKAALDSSARPIVEKRCGDYQALVAKIDQAPAPSQAKTVIDICKLGKLDEPDLKNLSPWGILLSTVVVDELAAQPESNADEKKIAQTLVNLCRLADR